MLTLQVCRIGAAPRRGLVGRPWQGTNFPGDPGRNPGILDLWGIVLYAPNALEKNRFQQSSGQRNSVEITAISGPEEVHSSR